MSVQDLVPQESVRQQLDSLYADNHSWLLNVLRRRLGCVSTAEDLCHDVFMRLLGRSDLAEFQEPRAYLARIARGLVIDRHRREVIEQAYLDALSKQPELVAPSPEESALVVEALVGIDAMLGSLKPKVRETFLMSRFDGLTYKAIAAELGISVATVRKYMLIAIKACAAAVNEA